jgi:hypothetical protein
VCDRVLSAAGWGPAVGLVGLVVNLLFGFEESDPALLTICGLLLIAPALLVPLHLRMSRELTVDQKAIWRRELRSGVGALLALTTYLTTRDRVAATIALQTLQAMRDSRKSL